VPIWATDVESRPERLVAIRAWLLIFYRLIQLELLLTRFGGSTQADVRVSTGIVMTFGRL
jgi:hypothetical protein